MTEADSVPARSDVQPLSQAEIVEAIRNRRRRYVLYYLANHDQPVAFDDLVGQVAAWEQCTTPERLDRSQRKSVWSALHQTHLPHLEQLGLVTYDRRRKLVSLRVDRSEFGLYLANDPHTTVAWYRIYLALTVGGLALLGLASTGVVPGLSARLVALLLFGVFAAASLLYWYDVRRWKRRMADMPPDFLLTLGDDVTIRPGADEDEDREQ